MVLREQQRKRDAMSATENQGRRGSFGGDELPEQREMSQGGGHTPEMNEDEVRQLRVEAAAKRLKKINEAATRAFLKSCREKGIGGAEMP